MIIIALSFSVLFFLLTHLSSWLCVHVCGFVCVCACCSRYAKTLVEPGITTAEVDRLVHARIIDAGAYPSPLNYRHFPKSLTTSVNNVIVHGVPDVRPLEPTDLINLDVSVYIGGFHGDCSATVALPDLDPQGHALIACAEASLQAGIHAVAVPERIACIGRAVENVVKRAGYEVCREFIGHGIGHDFHAMPAAFAFDLGMVHGMMTPEMRPGMVFTIEPAVNEKGRDMRILHDGWTAVTLDGGRSAQFEHTVHVTEDGAEILTVI